jgi:hypothetical protein
MTDDRLDHLIRLATEANRLRAARERIEAETPNPPETMHTVTQNEEAPLLATVAGTCPVTGKPWTLTVVLAEYQAWRRGALIQTAFLTLKPEEREMLQSGTSPEGWAILLPPTGQSRAAV